MKPLVYSSIIIIVIIAFGAFTINMLKNEAENLHTVLIELEKNIYAEEWEKAKNIGETIEKQWDKYKKIWPMLIDHFEIDNVNINLAELQAYILSNDKAESLSRLSALKVLIKHIPERESFTIQNIL